MITPMMFTIFYAEDGSVESLEADKWVPYIEIDEPLLRTMIKRYHSEKFIYFIDDTHLRIEVSNGACTYEFVEEVVERPLTLWRAVSG